MAIWKEPTSTKNDVTTIAPEPVQPREADRPVEIVPTPSPAPTRRTSPNEMKESIIAAGISITGKIDGAGHVRIAGVFEGDVHIKGDLTIDAGAKLTGSVRAEAVKIGGEVEGNIESAESVELLSTGVLTGDLKGGTLTVASGSRMRGRVEFGWSDEAPAKGTLKLGSRQAS